MFFDSINPAKASARRRGSGGWWFTLIGLSAFWIASSSWQSGLRIWGDSSLVRSAYAGHVVLASDTHVSDLELAFERVHQDVSPSVVSLHVTRTATVNVDGKPKELAQLVQVNGTGCVVARNGLILTNEHVVQNALTITVILHDGTELAGRVYASDVRHDLAIIHVNRQDLQPVRWCDWPEVKRGQWVLAIGNPYGIARDGVASLSVGVISNLGRRLPELGLDQDRLYTNLIQTTTPVHPGNSGGPLFNLSGEVVGIVTAVYLRAGIEDGVGFAIAGSPAKRAIIDQLCEGSDQEHAYLGLVVQDRYADDEQRRPMVIAIDPQSPASRAGVEVGDVITAFSGSSISGADQLAEQISALDPDTDVSFKLERAGTIIATRAVLERRVHRRITWMRHNWLAWRGARFSSAEDEESRQEAQSTR